MLNLNRYRERASRAEITIPDDIAGAMWTKWVFIVSIGGIQVVRFSRTAFAAALAA